MCFSQQEALQLFRPDFILRSQRRVHEVEQRARERRGLQPVDSTVMVQKVNRRQLCTKPHPLSGMMLTMLNIASVALTIYKGIKMNISLLFSFACVHLFPVLTSCCPVGLSTTHRAGHKQAKGYV